MGRMLRCWIVVAVLGASMAFADTGDWTSGRIRAVAVVPDSPTVIAIGNGSAFISNTQGLEWRRLPVTSARSIAVSGSGEAHDLRYIIGGDGVSFASTDGGGVQWEPIGGLDGQVVQAVAVDPTNADIVYAAAWRNNVESAVLKSEDGGETWQASAVGLPDQFGPSTRALIVDPQTPTTLYLALEGLGVFKSIDAGATWAPANAGLPFPCSAETSGNVTVVAVCLANLAIGTDPTSTTLYIGTSRGLFRSSDGGTSWTLAGAPLNGGSVSALAVDASNPATVYAATRSISYDIEGTDPSARLSRVYRSGDRGTTWSEVSRDFADAYVSALSLDPSEPNRVYVWTGEYIAGGLYRSVDGGESWQPASGLNATCISALTATATVPTTLRVGISGELTPLRISIDGGLGWAAVDLDTRGYDIGRLVSDPSDPGTIYAVARYGLLYKTTNGGQTWLPVSDPAMGYVIDLAVDPRTPTTLYTAGPFDGVDRSTDGGATWSPVHNASLTRGQVRAIAVDTASGAVYAAYDGALFRSVDAGATWEEGSLHPPPYIHQLVVAPTKPATLFAVNYEELHVSRDHGHTWRTIRVFDDESRVSAVVVDPARPRTVYAAGFGTGGRRVFRSDDAGEHLATGGRWFVRLRRRAGNRSERSRGHLHCHLRRRRGRAAAGAAVGAELGWRRRLRGRTGP